MQFFGALSKESGDKLKRNIKKMRKMRDIADKERIERMKKVWN